MSHIILIVFNVLVAGALGCACFILLCVVRNPLARMMGKLFLFFLIEIILATISIFLIEHSVIFSTIRIVGRLIELTGIGWFIYSLLHIEEEKP